MSGRRRSKVLSLAFLALAVVLLEVAIFFGYYGLGQPGRGPFEPQPPFGVGSGQANSGLIQVSANITRLCIPPYSTTGPTGISLVQGGPAGTANSTGSRGEVTPQTSRLTVPIQGLSVLLNEIAPTQGVTTIMTNSSGMAQSEVSAGLYAISIGDLRVNTSLVLRVSSGERIKLTLLSKEDWTPAKFFTYTSGAVSGDPIPWDNFTAVFPRLLNYSAGGDIALILGNLPTCDSILSHAAASLETLAPVFSVEDRQGGVWTTFAAPSPVKTPLNQVTMVTYTSEHEVETTDA
jgi:hypothetical protein